MWNSCTSVLPNSRAWEQQNWNKTIKDKGEKGKKKGMNVKRSTAGTKKSRQPKRQKSLYLVQSRQSLTTVCQSVSHSRHFFLKSLLIYTCRRKEHTCWITMWFTFQFRSYLQRRRVNYLSSSKWIGYIICLLLEFSWLFLKIAPVPHSWYCTL